MSIRQDIYSVKEKDPSMGNRWCHVLMTRDISQARNRAVIIRADQSLGVVRRAKIVHPAQHIVDAYVAAGNSIN